DQDVHPLFEMVTLLLVVDAAEGETEREPRMRAENFGVAMDLNRQLARWCDDQRTRSVEIARNRSRFANQPCVHRDEKGCGFPRTRLCLTGDIQSRKRVRQRLCLDGRATLEAGVGQPLFQGFG